MRKHKRRDSKGNKREITLDKYTTLEGENQSFPAVVDFACQGCNVRFTRICPTSYRLFHVIKR